MNDQGENNVKNTATEDIEVGGIPSPSETIKASLQLVDEIVKARGSGTPSTRKDISIVTGKAQPTLILKLSTCVQYELLYNQYGKGYLPTKLYEQYSEPIYEEDKKKVLLKILNTPPIYKQLIEEFNGKVLPPGGGLVNHLKNKYKLNPNSAVRAARIFLENLRLVGVLDIGNRLRYIPPTPETFETEKQKNDEDGAEGNGRNNYIPPPASGNGDDEADMIEIKIPLKDKRRAVVKFPENYTDAELDKIARIVRAYKQNNEEEK